MRPRGRAPYISPLFRPYISLYLPMYLLLEVPDRVLVGELQLLELELKRPLVLVRDRVRDRVRVGVREGLGLGLGTG